jgi:ubiquinone/menaquinone biosynthesis C-methylase UbiE
MNDFKEAVRRFWDAKPCGTGDIHQPLADEALFSELERQRDAREPFIKGFADFPRWRDRKVLEVGFGAGTDLIRFARAGAQVHGVDMTQQAVDLTIRRLRLERLSAELQVGDAEALPYATGTFDLVYSWGVIHHTADTPQAARELIRVAKSGGSVCAMLYHRRSLVALQCWLLHALLKGQPQRSLTDVISHHMESPGTKAFSLAEARALFPGLQGLTVRPILTPYDARIGRRIFLPSWVRRLLPDSLGWFLVVRGTKE